MERVTGKVVGHLCAKVNAIYRGIKNEIKQLLWAFVSITWEIDTSSLSDLK